MQSRISHIVAIASGKGGVGKSTVAMNLAMALRHRGKVVGLLDADIYGPSQKRMLGVADEVMPEQIDEKRLRPVSINGIEAMSMGFLTDEKTPWCGEAPWPAGALSAACWNRLSGVSWMCCWWTCRRVPVISS